MKKFGIIFLIALIHFAISGFIVKATALVSSTLTSMQAEPSVILKTLVWATRVIHFPIISQSLYSRQWFPGGWIYIPTFLNSMLWAIGIYFLFYIYKKLKKKTSDEGRKH